MRGERGNVPWNRRSAPRDGIFRRVLRGPSLQGEENENDGEGGRDSFSVVIFGVGVFCGMQRRGKITTRHSAIKAKDAKRAEGLEYGKRNTTNACGIERAPFVLFFIFPLTRQATGLQTQEAHASGLLLYTIPPPSCSASRTGVPPRV